MVPGSPSVPAPPPSEAPCRRPEIRKRAKDKEMTYLHIQRQGQSTRESGIDRLVPESGHNRCSIAAHSRMDPYLPLLVLLKGI